MPEHDDRTDDDPLKAILRRVRRIELITRGKVKEKLGGEYHSSFKGQGIDFDDFREYQAGDEVRAIDWNVTARMGVPFVKTFVEEREMTVLLAVDISGSMDYGSGAVSKREYAAEVAAAFAFAAAQNKDKVGLLLFAGGIELFIGPQKGSSHILRLIREILYARPPAGGSQARAAMDMLVRQVPRRSLILLVSDFTGFDAAEALKVASIKHDVVAVQISDPAERELPDTAALPLADAETGEPLAYRRDLRYAYAKAHADWQAKLRGALKRRGVDHIPLSTDEDYLSALHAFFSGRSARAFA
ncbi:MAG: DUF58 domain-containing protein [Verrucomicrobiales bacterium]